MDNVIQKSEDRRLCVDVNHAVSVVYDLGYALADAVERVAPLDDLACHDSIVPELEPDPDPVMAFLNGPIDPIASRLKLAKTRAEDSLRNLRSSLQELEELLRGEERDRYEQPVRRAIDRGEHLVTLMTEMNENYRCTVRNQPYSIRQNALAGLTNKTLQAARRVDQVLKRNEGGQCRPELLVELQGYVTRLFDLKRAFSRLRDNPSEKMGNRLRQLAEEVDSIHAALCALSEKAYTLPKLEPGRSGLGYNRKPSEAFRMLSPLRSAMPC